jgi:hypothetical protein
MKKKLTIRQVQAQRETAKMDLKRWRYFEEKLKKVPVLMTEHDMQFLMSFVDLKPEDVKAGKMYEKFALFVDDQIVYTENYLQSTEKWLKEKLKPRCCLPKKRQRELGMLPPV